MAWKTTGKVTGRERFLAEMDAMIPWPRLIALIEPHYPKAGNGRRPPGLEKMPRIYTQVLVQSFPRGNLSDEIDVVIYDRKYQLPGQSLA